MWQMIGQRTTDNRIIAAQEFTDLPTAINYAADWITHQEEDAGAYADGLTEAWDGSQTSGTHQGYRVTVFAPSGITLRMPAEPTTNTAPCDYCGKTVKVSDAHYVDWAICSACA